MVRRETRALQLGFVAIHPRRIRALALGSMA
jgi:hypothetical protein